MKLLHRTTRDFLLATVIIMTITGIVLYLLLKNEVHEEMKEQLAFQAELIRQQMQSGRVTEHPFSNIVATSEPLTTKPEYGDTLLYDQVQQKSEDYHYLKTVKVINGQAYKITVLTIYIGWENYYKTIFYLFLAAIILMAGSGVLINYLFTKKIWKPFFLNLGQLKKYSVSHTAPLQLHHSTIKEFKELQTTLVDLTDRAHKEYIALREFTENASHELQTPLGIIQSKLDRLSQLEVTEEMATCIVQAKSGVERLRKMNKNLLLLAKLDNHAFENKHNVDLQEVTSEYLAMMAELFATRNISINTDLHTAVVLADPNLCEILVSNLISNALRYTSPGGTVTIDLHAKQLTVTNDGRPLDLPADKLFDRFKKTLQQPQSTGLGLAIVWEICNMYGWQVGYEYQERHIFTIVF